jgi:hypothetical protein
MTNSLLVTKLRLRITLCRLAGKFLVSEDTTEENARSCSKVNNNSQSMIRQVAPPVTLHKWGVEQRIKRIVQTQEGSICVDTEKDLEPER